MTDKLFISYARKDDYDPRKKDVDDYSDPRNSFVRRLYESLSEEGYEVWWDWESMPARGLKFSDEIERAIDEQDRVLVILGVEALTSEYVRDEWEYALKTCKVVIPILRGIQFEQMPPELKPYQAFDFRATKDFDESFQLLLNRLEGAPRVGKLHGAEMPNRPDNYLPRPADLADIQKLLQQGKRRDGKPVVLLLHGMGGLGKSALAADFVNDCHTRQTFSDGIFWFRIGTEKTEGDLLGFMGVIGQAFGDDPNRYMSSSPVAKTYLKEVLADKHCLIVLDDIWQADNAKMFIEALGHNCRMLITTRKDMPDLALGASPTRLKLSLLSAEQSIRLLEGYTGRPDPNLARIARHMGYLPLALSLAGSRLKKGTSPQEYLEKFNRVSRIKVAGPNPTRETSLQVCFEISVNEAFADNPYKNQQALYHSLGIFKEDHAIPLRVVLRLWRYLQPEFDDDDYEELIEYLDQLALVAYDQSAKVISVHDLLHSYNAEMLGPRLPDTHEALLASYRQECGEDWYKGPDADDGYFFPYLCYHLCGHPAHHDELTALLLDFRWIQKRLTVGGVVNLINDYDLALRNQPNLDLSLVRDALRLSAHVLKDDPQQAASQLVGRLLPYADHPAIRDFLAGIDPTRIDPKAVWIRPLRPTLMPPGAGLVRTLYGHTDEIWSACVTLDGTKAVSAAKTRVVKVWNLETGNDDVTLEGHSDSAEQNTTINTMSISLDGKLAVTASSDKTVILWDLERGKKLRTFVGHDDGVLWASISPDNKRILSSSTDQRIILWNLDTGEIIHRLVATTPGTETRSGTKENTANNRRRRPPDYEQVWRVLFSPDGKKALSVSTDHTAAIWDLAAGTVLHVLVGHTDKVVSGTFLPDGESVFTASADGTIRQWDVDTGEQMRIFGRHATSIWGIDVSADGKRAVSVSSDHIIKVWDVPNRSEVFTIDGHSGGIWDAGISASGDVVVTGADDETVRVWSPEKHKTIDFKPEKHGSFVRSVALLPGGRRAVSASGDSLKVWDLSPVAGVLTVEKAHDALIWSVAISADGRTAVTASADKTVKVWDADTWTPVRTLVGHTCAVRSVAISADATVAVSASTDRTLRVWDLSSGETRAVLIGHTGALKAVALSSDARHAVTGSADGTVKIWNIVRGVEMRTIEVVEGEHRRVTAVAITADGQQIVSASQAGIVGEDGATSMMYKVELWDFDTGDFIRSLGESHESEVTDVCVNNVAGFSTHALSVSTDFTAKIWNLDYGRCEATFTAEGKLAAGDFISDDMPLIVGGYSGLLHVLKF